MIKYILIFSFFISSLNNAVSQAKWIGGAPKHFFQNHITACGPYHFVADREVLYRNTQDYNGWERVDLNIGGKAIWSMHGFGDRLIVYTEPGNLQYSDDFGASFVLAGQGAGTESSGQFFQMNDSIVYFLGEKRFLVSYNGGANFSSRFTMTTGGASAYYKNHGLYIDRSTPGPRVILSEDHFRTHVIKYATDITTGSPSCMAVLDSTFFVGTIGSPNIYFTRDFGNTWDSVFTDSKVNTFYKLVSDENGIWAGTNAGVLRSNSDGSVWTLIPYDQSEDWPLGEPVTKDIYVCGDSIYTSLYECLLLRSIDEGITWDVHLDGIYGGNIFKLYDDGIHLSLGTNDGQFIASLPDYELQLRRSRLFEQYDIYGWEFMDWLHDDGVQFSYWLGVYTSTDQGLTFDQVDTGPAFKLIEHQDTMWYGSWRMVFYSPDNGITWNLFRNFGNKIAEDIQAVYRANGVLTLYAGDLLQDGYIYSVTGFGGEPQLEFQDPDYHLGKGLTGGDSVIVADGFSRGVPISIDSGWTWTFIEYPLVVNSRVHGVAYLNGVVIAATSNGLWAYGVNSGLWTEVDPHIFKGDDVYSTTSFQGDIYVANFDEGIYQLDMDNVECLLDPLRSDCGKMSGSMFFTTSDTCARDSNAIPMAGELIEILPGPHYAFVQPSGEFLLPVDHGQYTVQPHLAHPVFYELLCPPSGNYQVDINSSDLSADSLNFFLGSAASFNELSIDVVCQSLFRLNQPVRFIFTCKNQGNTKLKPFVEFNIPESMDLVTASIVPDFMNETRLEWAFDTISPGEVITYFVDFRISSTEADIGDTLTMTGLIFPILEDALPETNIDSLTLVIIGAIDPNDKLVEPLGKSPSGFIPKSTDAFEYTIRFQNTGTDTAFAVAIIDTLDEIFDLSTIRILSSNPENANPYLKQNILKIDFPDILLPDSNTNYLGSQGYFHFRIKLKEPLQEGDLVKNQAYIIFDQQAPLATNVALNTVETISSLESALQEITTLQVFPNPTSNIIHGKTNDLISGGEFRMYDILGREMVMELLAFGNGLFKIRVADHVGDGVYVLMYSCKERADRMTLVTVKR